MNTRTNKVYKLTDLNPAARGSDNHDAVVEIPAGSIHPADVVLDGKVEQDGYIDVADAATPFIVVYEQDDRKAVLQETGHGGYLIIDTIEGDTADYFADTVTGLEVADTGTHYLPLFDLEYYEPIEATDDEYTGLYKNSPEFFEQYGLFKNLPIMRSKKN
jgi:hypothetical protein